jgi:glucosylglycerate synthase
LAQVVSPLFSDVERHAPFWQRIRGSRPLTTFGVPFPAPEEPAGVDVTPMLESFQLGFRNLAHVWGAILPPGTMIELKRMSVASAAVFRMIDEVWARIVYDFAMGYHLRVMNRDHLLGALTPLYLAWVASYALESQRAAAFNVEHRLEQLCLAFEAQKPYFQSRWRWPDRFNP